MSISTLRSAGTAAGPLAVLALLLLIAAMFTAGDAPFAVETSPLALASTGAQLLGMIAMVALAVAAALRAERDGRGFGTPLGAAVGAVLVVGGSWAGLFVLPTLGPGASAESFAPVSIGYVVSFLLFSVTWVALAVGLVRCRVVPIWLGLFLGVAAVLATVPAPEAARLLPVCIAETLVARRLVAPAHLPAATR